MLLISEVPRTDLPGSSCSGHGRQDVNNTHFKKVCLLGDFAVGKTSLVRRYVDAQFSDEYLSTVGVKISRKQIEMASRKTGELLRAQLILWDLEGSTLLASTNESYLKGAAGAIVVGDVTRQDTLTNIKTHIAAFLRSNPNGFLVVSYNKSDLMTGTQSFVSPLSFEGHDRVLESITTSAKSGEHIEQLFGVLCRKLVDP
ncbi:MAG: GTP-binding protein [Bacteroidetes bacterium]|nr:GTP-binding protein [Bacteroidota bacterium]MCW5895067.1 GTP-binding protein [Bacteroidota bacterium]